VFGERLIYNRAERFDSLWRLYETLRLEQWPTQRRVEGDESLADSSDDCVRPALANGRNQY
jgi:hypothetical protein